MRTLKFRKNHKIIAAYQESLAEVQALGITHETAARTPFQNLLEGYSKLVSARADSKWKLVTGYALKNQRGERIVPDAVLLDGLLPRGV